MSAHPAANGGSSPRTGFGARGASARRISLLDLDLDLVSYVTPEDRQVLRSITLPVLDLSNEHFDITWLGKIGAFGAIVLRGMLFHTLQVGAQPGMRILGPGDIIVVQAAPSSDLIVHSEWRAGDKTALAPLGSEVMLAIRRVPRLLTELSARIAEQVERLTTQMTISQLPRVEDRVLSMFWLLAEAFGRVTSAGTSLPLSPTHETIGFLVGARRPTVSLALRRLAETGVAVQRDGGWLLLERPVKAPPARGALSQQPPHWQPAQSDWHHAAGEAVPDATFEALTGTVERLRVQHLRNLDRVNARLRRASEVNRRSAELRERLRGERQLRSRRLPSSG